MTKSSLQNSDDHWTPPKHRNQYAPFRGQTNGTLFRQILRSERLTRIGPLRISINFNGDVFASINIKLTKTVNIDCFDHKTVIHKTKSRFKVRILELSWREHKWKQKCIPITKRIGFEEAFHGDNNLAAILSLSRPEWHSTMSTNKPQVCASE